MAAFHPKSDVANPRRIASNQTLNEHGKRWTRPCVLYVSAWVKLSTKDVEKLFGKH